jgi:hypothetical protein
MSSVISYIKNAQKGVSLSRCELEQIFENKIAHTLLCECLENSTFKPYLFQEFVSNIKNGNLGPLGSFYPLNETYITNNKKTTGQMQYDGMCNTDCSNMIGKNKNCEVQDIASTIISFVLFMGNNNITDTKLLEGFKNFILNPPANYKIKIVGNMCSPLSFAGTGIGGSGELIIEKNNNTVGLLQIDSSPKDIEILHTKLKNTNTNEEIAKYLLGNVGMLWALGMPESYKLNNNEDNKYYWGPEKLIEYGIIKC